MRGKGGFMTDSRAEVMQQQLEPPFGMHDVEDGDEDMGDVSMLSTVSYARPTNSCCHPSKLGLEKHGLF